MAELSIPFDSRPIDGKDDRIYYSKDFAGYFRQFIGNGVYPNPSSGLRVDASGTSMVLTIHEGGAYINGRSYTLDEEPMQLAVSPAHMSYNRKDAIVVQLNHTERAIRMKYKEGKAESNPSVPVLIRTDDIYELRLAEILIVSIMKEFVIITTKTANGFREKINGTCAPPKPMPPNANDILKISPNMGIKLID